MEEKTISSKNARVHLFPILLLMIVVLSGCWSGQEKIHKVFALVAEVVEGDYHVESFLIDGEPPTEGMTRMPGSEVIVTVTFTRNWDVPKDKPIRVFLVGELKEGNIHRAGSHTMQYEDEIPSRPGKIKQTIKATIPLLDAADADRAEKIGLGRYCKLIISELGSEIVSHKIYIAK